MEEQEELNIKWDADFSKMCIEKYVISAASKPKIRLDLVAAGWDTEFLYYQDDPVINDIATKCKALLAAELAKNV